MLEMLKKWGIALLAILGTLVGFGWLFGRARKVLGRVRDRETVDRAKKEIADLKGERARLDVTHHEQVAEANRLDRRLDELRRELADAHENGSQLSADEVSRELSRLGF